MLKKYISMFREDMRYVMAKRNGLDELNNFIMLIAFIYVLAAMFTHKWGFVVAGAVFVVITYMRVFSKNIAQRQKENDFYMHYMGNVVEFVRFCKLSIKLFIRSIRDKEYVYFVCKTCGQVIRIPKGKNKISVKCPRCSTTFVKRT